MRGQKFHKWFRRGTRQASPENIPPAPGGPEHNPNPPNDLDQSAWNSPVVPGSLWPLPAPRDYWFGGGGT